MILRILEEAPRKQESAKTSKRLELNPKTSVRDTSGDEKKDQDRVQNRNRNRVRKPTKRLRRHKSIFDEVAGKFARAERLLICEYMTCLKPFWMYLPFAD